MKVFTKIFIVVLFIFSWESFAWASADAESTIEKNYFQFVITKYHTTRQSGQTLNIYVRYAYKQDLAVSEYPDYRKLRASILAYMEPTNEFPAGVYWEVLATKIGKDLMSNYPLEGLSIQLEVLDNPDPNTFVNHHAKAPGVMSRINLHASSRIN